MVTARFPIGRDSSARAVLKFGWMTDYGDVNPQSDILLQVATDLFERNLVRLRSRLAPEASTEPAPASPPEPVAAPSDQALG